MREERETPKATLQEWLEWAQTAKISEAVLQWVKDNPQVLQDITNQGE